MKFVSLAVVALLALSLPGGPVAAGQEGYDMKLEDVGFVMRPANTPAQMERLRLLPPRKFVARNKGGRRYYIYADPNYCQCVFVGGEVAMTNLRALRTPIQQPPMPLGPDGGPVAGSLIEEIDPGLALSIGDGDILDY